MAPHNPQYNGVVEKKKKSIVGVARAMLHDQGLPLHLWVEACNKKVFVQSCSPHRILGMGAPKKDFSGKKPNVSYFKIFGSSIYVHVIKDSMKKLKPTTEIGIFVGYNDNPHNHRVYFPNNMMNIVRWDIKFDEEKAM